jgi:WD40 repeat protein
MSDLSIRLRAAVVTVLAITVAACGSTPRASNPRTSSSPGEPNEASPGSSAQTLLYLDEDGLWFYSLGSSSPRKIAEKNDTSTFALESASEATFFDANALRVFDAAQGKTHTMLAVSRGQVLDWSPNHAQLAYMTVSDDENGSSVAAYLYTPGDPPHPLWTSRKWAGRGGSQLDEISIAWSPDGETLLIVVTPLDTALDGDRIVTADTIYVLRTDGSQALTPRLGTMARWSPDGRSIYYRRHGASGTWRVLTVASGEEKPLGLPSEAYRPRVSPDGKKIAFDDGKAHPSVFVFDIASATTQLMGKDYVSPIWLSATSLAAGKTTLCGLCEGPQWKPAGGTTRWDIDPPAAPSATSMPIGSIAWGADVFLG